MLFNSYSFLFLYLPVVLLGFFSLIKFKAREMAIWWLFFASLLFYGLWDYRFVSLLFASIVINYVIGKKIFYSANQVVKQALLAIGICLNLGTLFYFKYFNFFVSSVLGYTNLPLNVILPLGISFFTFTQLAFLVDAYKQKIETPQFSSYGLFVTFFPHLIAGPILHHKDMMSQFKADHTFTINYQNISNGIFLFTIGMFKKVIIADPISAYVRTIFDSDLSQLTFITSWLGAFCYTLQLYFDFSGYSDMAVGLGYLFNINLPVNFDSPYKASSIIDFWRRWHISLSNFLRDYLYIPLGGNRHGKYRKYLNLFLTLFLGGIWHGAGWTYVLWGACHGSFLVINHLWRDLKIQMSNWLSRTLTLFAVVVAWVIFRSTSITAAKQYLLTMFGFNGIVLPEPFSNRLFSYLGFKFALFERYNLTYLIISLIFALLLSAFFLPNSQELKEKYLKKPMACGIACGFVFWLCVSQLDKISEFIYYQF